MFNKLASKNRHGFTLVEIMIVVAIIGLLAAIAIPNFVRARQTAQTNACINNLRQIDGAKEQWALENKKNQGDAVVVADVDSLASAWAETSAEMEAFLASLTEEQLAADATCLVAGERVTRPLWQPVCQMVNHSTYHRGQVASLLRQLGYQPPGTDLIYFFLK